MIFEGVSQVVRGVYATPVDETQLLLIPAKMEVIGEWARRPDKTDEQMSTVLATKVGVVVYLLKLTGPAVFSVHVLQALGPVGRECAVEAV
jgi:hypothetical protein